MKQKRVFLKKGIVVIPDISGFTDFVMSTKLLLGQFIICKLLHSIVRTNNLHFEISEIEGDAVLFYKYGNIPTFVEIISQIKLIHENFKTEIERLSIKLMMDIPLSLKVIVHYGAFSKYRIGRFEKLYGIPIVEAHKMLKYRIPKAPPYALLSDEYLAVYFSTYSNALQYGVYIPDVGYIHYF
ncbi:DUF2652 domain-containing protein [Rhizosphaericola mali]|uniref:DUF2652 domain-containing protein n=1 Tax=Rhizosphaericola mali TaxID=2545455 RepID=A0A5P2FZ26_9BACT|nr:DUF2652 domain-containing protein [Rhizosphaericola mali]QES87648.1 DUF2652 domain-containing protein [Rhizosphaericola mali]